MLVVRDAESNAPRAVYVSYACHCVTLSFNQINGDWAGYAAAMIERQMPGVVALVSIGAGSDQNPVSGVTGDRTDVAEMQGLEIATEVARLLDEKSRPISGAPNAIRNQIALPLNPLPTREELVRQTTTGRPTDQYNATTQLARFDRGEPLLSQIDYLIQTWTFGDSFCMTFLAGEVCVDYALRLKKDLDRDRFWLNTYSNDFCCYIPSERLVVEGGYGGGAEVPYFALPTTLKAGLEQLIVDEVHRQVPRTFHVSPGTQGVAPKDPQESMQCMKLSEDLRVELVAAEPQISDPVAIDFGPDGSLWVAEMNDYGHDVYDEFRQTGRIQRLRDLDGDGFFESAHTFVGGLRFPTDVKVWRDGVLICDAPDILFARDVDGDGVAEIRTVLFSGFEIRNAQARVNSLRFGLDHWVYGAGGLFGGVITSSMTGMEIDCSNRDFRINPDDGIIEAVSGRTQQGRCRNDWGDWFGCSNGSLLFSIPADDQYIMRNPLAAPQAFPVVSFDDESHRLYPPKELVTFELSGAPGRATSACGAGIYRDVLLGSDFQDDAFTCEPVHQSVHRIDFRREGDAFAGRRGVGEESREFLCSSDRWFRPVQACTGPDGALWVVDMYRYVIEHSRWIPRSTLAELDVYAGQGRGRIYRVLPRDETRVGPVIPNLKAMENDVLAQQLNTPNGIIRDLVHQLLVWRKAIDSADTVRAVAAETDSPAVRIQCLAVLNGLGQLSAADVQAGLQSESGEVQRFAVQLSESFMAAEPGLRTLVCNLAASSHSRVRRQVALSLGVTIDDRSASRIAQFLSTSEPNSIVRSAALNSVNRSNVASVLHACAMAPKSVRVHATWQKLLGLAVQDGDAELLNSVLTELLPDPKEMTPENADLWLAVLKGLDARFASRTVEGVDGDRARRVCEHAMVVLGNPDATEEQRLAAIRLAGRRFGAFSATLFEESGREGSMSPRSRAEVVAKYLNPRYSSSLQTAALAGVAATGAPDRDALLLAAYPSLNADLRNGILSDLMSRTISRGALLNAIGEGMIRRDAISAADRDALLSASDAELRQRAEAVLGGAVDSDRMAVVRAHHAAIESPGDVSIGREVFRRRCSTCHQLENYGTIVGPDLGALTNRDSLWLLTTILDPNKDVDGRFLSWSALTTDGLVYTGMIVEESATEIRLREAGGKEHVIARSEIDEFRSSQKSVMPEGLERDMSIDDFRHVIAYLQGMEPPAKKLDGNHPRRITPGDDGQLRLTAATAEIRGTDITFESSFKNIGYWHHQADSATWRIEVASAGAYDIYLDASCADSAAGNEFRIDGLIEPVQGTVVGTGGWDRYQQQKIGTTQLRTGAASISLRADSAVREALFDLREIRLVPAGRNPGFAAAPTAGETPLPRYPPEIAPFLLDESQKVQRRQQVIDQRPGMGPGIISLLAAGVKPGDSDEEYRRIPWIWRVAIAVGKRNDGGEIRDVLEVSVPKAAEPLCDWQAVVIGGGLINGISQLGEWPRERIDEILNGLPAVQAAWPAALQKSSEMADNESVRSGTRYDALRMVALRDEPIAIAQLQRYLQKETPHELQMGAVSGLVDINSPAATQRLIRALQYLEGRNRQLAIEGLLRTPERRQTLLQSLQDGALELTREERQKLDAAGQ
ncbi:MAG: hypothetical protein KDA96_13840 [Planctomycetaceae bacterium]|nr:hypothetical protein [Planctomycetaceae bacterium]